MDIVVKGRHTVVPDHFRQHVIDKLSRIERLDHKVIRLDVEIMHERNPRQSDRCQRVEVTCMSKGPVIRAEAVAADFYAALDTALGKLEARLRRSADRRRVHHGARTPASVAVATSAVLPAATQSGAHSATSLVEALSERGASSGAALNGHGDPSAVVARQAANEDGADRAPLVVREKVHAAEPMTLDQALFEMELVGHDFYLFADAASGAPSVVYRRKGYDYGVIRLER